MTVKQFAVADDQLLTYYARLRELTNRVHRADGTSLLDLDSVSGSLQAIMEARYDDVMSAVVEEVPAVNQIFELEINGDLDITPPGWQFRGPDFPKGKRVHRAKLIELGYQPNLESARKTAKEKEPKFTLAPGAAREAFSARYPRHNDRLIVMGGQEWRGPRGFRLVPCLGRSDARAWDPNFSWSGDGFSDYWLWLVLEKIDA